MKKSYSIHFNFDCEGEPPKVYVWKNSEGEIIEIFEEPTCKLGGKFVETCDPGVWEWEGPWSWNEADWEAGPLAKKVLKLLIKAS